ncbi:hypothetical protein JCM33374_g799 [Metschnikowia sp. JCM 33374]|nr:hypothetical protein JCM33374_g799 [Metschnikowia sp. JCM 33374]
METQCNTPPTEQDIEKDVLIGVSEPLLTEVPASSVPENPVRSVNFILDPSAFTLGLGNIERWFDQEYFRSQVKDKEEHIHLNLYLPTYTLHELDYQKRGPIVGSTKASEALKFIDRILESDDGLPEDFDEANEESPEIVQNTQPGNFSYNMSLEYRTQKFPQWSACTKFQIRSPSSEELPLHGKYSLYDEINHNGGDLEAVFGESHDVPSRLKHLIRSGVYLTRMDHNGPAQITGDMWKLVTEDTATKVWASCFGIDCLNINQAELLLFHGKDLTKFEIKTEGADFFTGEDIYQTETPDALHKKVNTTSYKYTDLKAVQGAKNSKRVGGKRNILKNLKGKPQAESQNDNVQTNVRVESGVITEDFNKINFAPREDTTKLVVSKLFTKETKPHNKAKKAVKSNGQSKEGSLSVKASGASKASGEHGSSISEKNSSSKKTSAGKKKSTRKHKGAAPKSDLKAKSDPLAKYDGEAIIDDKTKDACESKNPDKPKAIPRSSSTARKSKPGKNQSKKKQPSERKEPVKKSSTKISELEASTPIIKPHTESEV